MRRPGLEAENGVIVGMAVNPGLLQAEWGRRGCAEVGRVAGEPSAPGRSIVKGRALIKTPS